MRAKARTDILLSPWFLLGLVTLLLNDFAFKYSYSNELTGKLSDFAGLFIFPFFLSAFFPRYHKANYALSIAVFSFWNSTLSQGLIDSLNSYGIQVGRTIDLTDFIAFAILPLSYLCFKTQVSKPKLRLRYLPKGVVSALAVFSFIATTLPRQEEELAIKSGKTFFVEVDKKEFFNRLQAGYGKSDTLELNLGDSLFYLHYYIPDIKADMLVLANIQEHASKTVIRVDSIQTASVSGSLFSGVDEDDIRTLEVMGRAEHEEYFQKYFIHQLLRQTDETKRLYYNNKRIYDEIVEQYE